MTTIFTYVALGYIALAAVDRFYHDRPSWEDSAYMLFLIITSTVVFVFSKDMAVAIVNNAVADFIIGNQAGQNIKVLVYCLLLAGTTGIAWHGLMKYIVKPGSTSGKLFLSVASSLVGMSYMSSALANIATKNWGINSTDQVMFFGVAALIIFLAISLRYYHKEIQEVVAIPLGGTIVYATYIYAYYQYFGINLLEDARGAGHAAGGTIITIGLVFLYGIIWYRQKAWYERRSYKILAFFAMLMMVYSTAISVAYLIGAIDPYEWQATRDQNVATIKVDQRHANQTAMAIINGYTRESAMAVINDPQSSDQEVNDAMQSIKKRRELQAKRVEDKLTPVSVVNGEKIKKTVNPIYDFVKKSWEKRFWKDWWITPSKATKKSVVKVKIYPPGTYTIRLKAGETTNHWIMFPRGRKNNYSVMSKDNKFILILSNGQEYKGWGNINPPHMTRSKFKLKAINDQIITLKVT